jgi:ATPase subunit of ABC transporter with duplicated ATPase domains
MLRKELNWLAHGAKARTSKPKFRIDAAMALLADDPPLRNPVELRRMAVSRLGKQVMELKNVSAGYGEKRVLSGVDWLIGPGDRYGILGENGVGKSTLLKVMTGRMLPTKGFVKIGKSVKFGILSQHLDQLAEKDDWRVSELLGTFKRYYEVDGKMQSPEQMLERLGFERREFPIYIRDLSGGQRRRLSILCVLMQEPNVLVLDEPGNDLDTDMLAVLEDLLDTWPGTLILVSHDRYLMERVTDDQFAILGGDIRHVPGGVDEYLRLLAEGKQGASPSVLSDPVASAGTPAGSGAVVAGEGAGPGGLSNAERRELKKRYDAVTRKLDKLSGEPDRLREEMGSLDASDYEALMAAQARLDDALSKIDELETEWLELSERLGIG